MATSKELTQKILKTIKETRLLQDCDDSFLENLAEKSSLVEADKGRLLFIHEDKADNFFILRSGWVKLFRETLDGEQAVVDILTKNHIFGESAIFNADLYPYSAEVVENVEIIALPLTILKKQIETSPKFAMDMMSSMARYRRQQDQEIEHRTIQNASQRIGCFLLRLTSQKESGPIVIHLPYDKTLIASRLGMQPETFSRALSKLKTATGIKVKGATIEMDNLEQLSEYSCIACSAEFPCKDVV